MAAKGIRTRADLIPSPVFQRWATSLHICVIGHGETFIIFIVAWRSWSVLRVSSYMNMDNWIVEIHEALNKCTFQLYTLWMVEIICPHRTYNTNMTLRTMSTYPVGRSWGASVESSTRWCRCQCWSYRRGVRRSARCGSWLVPRGSRWGRIPRSRGCLSHDTTSAIGGYNPGSDKPGSIKYFGESVILRNNSTQDF